MSAEIYRLLHFGALFVLMLTLGVSYLSPKKYLAIKIANGIASVVVLVSGMGLIAKVMGIPHSEPWPNWLKTKIIIWAFLAIFGPVMAKRVQKNRELVMMGLFGLVIFNVYLVIYRPF
jgi:uncharacterized membrane protein SirB2